MTQRNTSISISYNVDELSDCRPSNFRSGYFWHSDKNRVFFLVQTVRGHAYTSCIKRCRVGVYHLSVSFPTTCRPRVFAITRSAWWRHNDTVKRDSRRTPPRITDVRGWGVGTTRDKIDFSVSRRTFPCSKSERNFGGGGGWERPVFRGFPVSPWAPWPVPSKMYHSFLI